MKNSRMILVACLLIGCADTAYVNRSSNMNNHGGLPPKSESSDSYKFNTVEIGTPNETKILTGVYYVEQGFQKWVITSNNTSSKYSSFTVDYTKFRGSDCASYALSGGTSENGK